jgi:hypothetical protein
MVQRRPVVVPRPALPVAVDDDDLSPGYIRAYLRRRYRYNRRCDCEKLPWRTEADARRHLTSDDHYPAEARVYKCPASAVWHVSTRGFSPEALRSRARILAWHLSARRHVDLDDLARREFGFPRWNGNNDFNRLVRLMRVAGLARWDADRPGRYLAAVDNDGLYRVCEVGLHEYLLERFPEMAPHG